jgi:hypothetical protein
MVSSAIKNMPEKNSIKERNDDWGVFGGQAATAAQRKLYVMRSAIFLLAALRVFLFQCSTICSLMNFRN